MYIEAKGGALREAIGEEVDITIFYKGAFEEVKGTIVDVVPMQYILVKKPNIDAPVPVMFNGKGYYISKIESGENLLFVGG